MLRKVWFENFKSYERGELPLAELTVLLGANASGKSNALEALQLLTWLAEGRRLGDLLFAVKEREIDLRGTPADLTRSGGALTFGCEVGSVAVDQPDLLLRLCLFVEEGGLRIVEEELARPGESAFPLYRVEQAADEYSNQVQVAYNNFSKGGNKPRIPAIDQQAIFTQLTTPARFESQHTRSQKEIPDAARFVQRTLENVLFLDPLPKRMREYSFKVEHRKLHGDGSNISAVLHHLCADPEMKARVLAFVRSLPEQDIRDITFLDGPRGEVMLSLLETFGGTSREFSAGLLSDGTLRVLAVAAALLSVPEGSLVVIEEIDNGVHPSRAKVLLDNINAVAKSRLLRVLLTTHNSALLDAIPSEALPKTVVCYRDPEQGDSRLLRLETLDQYPELVAQGPLGQVVTKGILDRMIKHPINTEQRRQAAFEFLRSIGQ